MNKFRMVHAASHPWTDPSHTSVYNILNWLTFLWSIAIAKLAIISAACKRVGLEEKRCQKLTKVKNKL